MSKPSLYRIEALNARAKSPLGTILMIRPVSFTALTALAVACAGLILTFMFLGQYTERTTVSGYLMPATGLLKVFVPQAGIVVEKRVSEGQLVRQGDVLFVLSGERRSGADAHIQASISEQVDARRESLQSELEQTRRLQQDELAVLMRKADGYAGELAKLDAQLSSQRSRAQLAEQTFKRYQSLRQQGFISDETLQQKQSDALDRQLDVQTLERNRITVAREQLTAQSELTARPLQHKNELERLRRSLSLTGQELTESEAKRNLVVTAPHAGVATAVLAELGQTVEPGKVLMSIVPAGAELQAHLFAPSRAIGFVKAGNAVQLRYHAFPYQKFGQAKGTVVSISRTALPAAEASALIGQNGNGNEAVYQITVALAAQTMTAYGVEQPLQSGMSVDADTMQGSRRLVEWVLAPLYSLTGKL